jgi:hypothetical protein
LQPADGEPGTGDLNGDRRDEILLDNGGGLTKVAWFLNDGDLVSVQDIGHTPAATQIGGSHFDFV